MTLMNAPKTQLRDDEPLSITSLPGLPAPSVEEHTPRPEEAEELHSDSLPLSQRANEVYLIIQADVDAPLLFRFCQSVREINGADIGFFTSTPQGTIIKLAMREPVPILDILAGITEVEETIQEEAFISEPEWDLPTFLQPNSWRAISVKLKAP